MACALFASEQGDIIVSYLFGTVLIYAFYIFVGPSSWGEWQYGAADDRQMSVSR